MTLRLFQPAIQALALLITSTAPLWVENFVSGDSIYAYLFEDYRYYIQMMVVMAIIVFLPQILSILKYIGRGGVTLSFYVSHVLIRRMKFLPMFLMLGPFLAVFGAASAMQGVAMYGFSWFRQHKYSEEISRQVSVEHINRIDHEQGPLASSAAIKILIQRYPDDPRNHVLLQRINDIAAASALAADFNREANAMAESGFHFQALELYRTAKAIFPHDHYAPDAITRYEVKFEDQKEQLSALYILCHERHPEAIAEAIPSISLLFWNSAEIVSKLTDLIPEERERAITSACTQVMGEDSPSEFLESLQQKLFGDS